LAANGVSSFDRIVVHDLKNRTKKYMNVSFIQKYKKYAHCIALPTKVAAYIKYLFLAGLALSTPPLTTEVLFDVDTNEKR
jgi:hypothetical protein